MNPKPTYEELVKRIQELENEVLIRAGEEDALRGSEKRYRSLVETSSDWLWEVDAKGRYTYVSSRVREILGYEPEEVVGRAPFDLMSEEEARRVRAICAEIQATRRPFALLENVNQHRDGRLVVLETSGVPVFDSNGEFTGYRGVDRDITERKRTAEALKEREQKFRAIFDQTFQFIGLLAVDGRLIEVNRNALQFAGIRESEVVGEPFWQTPWWTHSSEQQETLRAAIEKAAAGEFLRFETNHLSADGKLHYMDFSLKPVMDESGGVTFLIAEAREITVRRNAEEALRLSESRLSRAEVVARFGNWEFRLDSNEVYGSEGAKIIYGLEGGNWSIPEIQKIALPEYRGMLDNALTGLVEEGKPYNVEFKIRRPSDGKIVDISSIAEYSPEKNVVFGVIQDVTERRKTEDALRENETRLRVIADSARDAILMMDPEGRITYWNPAAERILGYTGEEALGQNLHMLLAPQQYHAAYHGAFPKFAETGLGEAVGKTLELVARRKDGEEIPVELSLSSVFLSGWQAVGLLRDISERKQTEAALKESQQRLANIIDFLPDATFVIDRDGKVIAWNRAMEEMTGIGAAQILGKGDYEYALPFYDERRPIFIDLIDVGDEELESKYKNIWKRRGILYTETYASNVYKGEGAYLFATAAPLFDAYGNRWGAIESIRDITDRKQAENKLKTAEAKYRAIFEDAMEGIFQTTPEGRYITANPALAKMLGFESPDELFNFVSDIGRQIYVDPAQRAELTRLLTWNDFVKDFEIQFLRKDGSKIWATMDCVTIRDSDGNVLCFQGTMLDITERKLAEEALRESQQQLANIIDFLPDATFVVDREGKVIAWNRAVEEMTGISATNMLGKGNYEYVIPFYGERRPMLVDLVLHSQTEIEAKYVALERRGGILLGEAYMPALRGGGRYLFGTASALYDSKGNLVGAIESIRDTTERRHMEEAILKAEEKYRNIFENSITAIYQITMEGRLLSVNMAGARILGYDSPRELLDATIDLREFYVHPERRSVLLRLLEEQGSVREFEVEFYRKDKSVVSVSINVRAVRNSDGKIAYMEGTALDITDRKVLQGQLEQAQKMESVGRLAGGIAHDFNNMLGVITGRSELALLQDIPAGVRKHLEEILKAGQRSADLTRQLLAFARKQTAAPKVLDLNDTISGMLSMLRRLIREDIELSWTPGLDLWKVKIDPSQVDQILANLLVNAGDAISGSGAVTIRTENMVIDNSDVPEHPEFIPGDYVLLTVNDTGAGMSKEVWEKIFEPFFTTKEVGKGTGLGLSTVYGIVKQNDGFIYVVSRLGEGTTFKIYLPRFETDAAQASVKKVDSEPPRGRETVLLVEDDEYILDLSRIILENLGYTVLVAHTPARAIQVARDHQGDIDLLVSDVVMPDMHGRELAEKLGAIRPNIKCLFMSGYTADVIGRHGVLDEGINFIHKPFQIGELAAKVRQLLES